MARALRVRLIAVKSELNKKKHLVQEELAHLQDTNPNLPASDDPELTEEYQRLEVENLRLKAQLNRAHLYGRLFAGDLIFRCIPCFVQHDVLLNMRRTKALVAGVKRYKCHRCGEEINSDDQP